MFETAHLGTVRWPVTLVQQTKSGTFEDVTITVTFRKLSRAKLKDRDAQQRQRSASQLMGLFRQQKGGDASSEDIAKVIDDANTEITKADREHEDDLLNAITDWEGPVRNGEPVPCERNTLIDLFDDEATFQAFAKALDECSRNAKPKNLSPGPAGTSAPAQM